MIRACLTDSRGLSRLLGSGYLQPTKAYLSRVSVVAHHFGTERYILGHEDWSKFGPTFCWLLDRSALERFTWHTLDLVRFPNPPTDCSKSSGDPVMSRIDWTTSKKCGNSSVFCGGHKKIVGADFYSPFVN